MSVRVQTYVWQLKLSPTEKLVAIALADHCHDDGSEARPSQTVLARKTGLDARSVRRILRRLVDLGVIALERPHGQHRANCYMVLVPDGFARPGTVPPLAPRPDTGAPDRTFTTPQTGHCVLLTIKEPSCESTNGDFVEVDSRKKAQRARELLRGR